jgi:hypothetical protein
MIVWGEQKRPPSFRPAGFAGLHFTDAVRRSDEGHEKALFAALHEVALGAPTANSRRPHLAVLGHRRVTDESGGGATGRGSNTGVKLLITHSLPPHSRQVCRRPRIPRLPALGR